MRTKFSNLIIVLLFIVACTNEEEITINKPQVTTFEAVNIDIKSADTGGKIISDGGSDIFDKGVCWGTSTYPTVNNNNKNVGRGSGNFKCYIADLKPNTKYYVRAYAENEKGISYGNEIQFTTVALTKPVISTNNVTDIEKTSVTCGGKITSTGGAIITASGVCWNTSSNPTINNYIKSNSSTYKEEFTSYVTGLKPNTKYYMRAYATNSEGTGYGDTEIFTTLSNETNEVNIELNGGYATYDLPINAYYSYSYSQQIYLASEIDHPLGGTITKIAINRVSGTDLTNTGSIYIYMANTTKNYFSSSSSWLSSTSLTEVKYISSLSSYIGIGTNWQEITLTTPFKYNGGNLLIAWKEGKAGSSPLNSFRAYKGTNNETIYFSSDATEPLISSPPAGTITDYKNSIQLLGTFY